MIILAVALLGGCISLDRHPDYVVESGLFWKTQEQADAAIAGVYARMKDQSYAYAWQFALDCLGNVGMGYDEQGIAPVSRGTYTSSTGWVTNKWKALYECVAASNYFLQNIGRAEISDDLRTVYEAEAGFLRAFNYFELTKFFGGIPYYDETLVVETGYDEMLKPRSTKEDIYEHILDDLEDAIAGLPEDWPEEFNGRVTKSAAYALKGKVLLYGKEYSKAALAFEEVLKRDHVLYPDYAGLFTPEGDSSSEMIFAFQNIGGVGNEYGMPMAFYMGTRSTRGSCWNNVMLSTAFADTYEWKDGRPFSWEDVFPGLSPADIFVSRLTEDQTRVEKYPEHLDKLRQVWDDRDPRLASTAILPYTEYKGWASNKQQPCEYVVAEGVNEVNGFVRGNNDWFAYFFRKFVPEYDMNGEAVNRAHTPINFPLIRLADVMLMLAECYNETERSDEAVTLVNRVRERVGMPGINSGPAYLSATSKEEVFERIRRERGWELAGEGHSFDDYKRWGLLEKLNGPMMDLLGTAKYTRVVNPRDYLWPIPQTERDINPDLTQNPDW